MTRRRLLLFGRPAAAVVLLGVIGSLALWLQSPATLITHENAAKIQPGMPLAELFAILGGPYSPTPPLAHHPVVAIKGQSKEVDKLIRQFGEDGAVAAWESSLRRESPRPRFAWASDHVLVVVATTQDDDRVAWCHFLLVRPAPPTQRDVKDGDDTFLERVRRKLGL